MKSRVPKAYKEEKKVIYNKRFGVIFNGEDNLKPLIRENAIDLSPTASQCSDLYASFLGGGGFDVDLDNVNLSEVFWKTTTPNDLLADVCFSASRHSGIYINVGYNANFNKKSYKVIPYRLCRLGKQDSEGYSGKIVVSPKGWGSSLKREDVHVYDVYNPNPEIIQQQVVASGGWHNYKGQILFFKFDAQYVYPSGLVERAFNFCEVEYHLSQYYKGTVLRRFEDIDVIRHRPFDNKEDERQFNKNIDEISGIESSSSKLILEDDWDDEREKTGNVRFDKLGNNTPSDKYKHFEESASNYIRKAFRNIPPQLVDYVSGKLGNTSGEDLIKSQSIYNANTARDRQKIERLFAELFRGFKININPTNDWSIKQYKLLDNGTTN